MSDQFDSTFQRIEDCINTQQYYPALQLIKSLNYRFCAQNCFQRSIELLFKSFTLFHSKNEIKIAVEISSLYMETANKHTALNVEQTISEITQIIQLIDLSDKDWESFVVKCLKWSQKFPSPDIQMKIHICLGYAYLKVGMANEARFYSINISDSVILTEFLVKYSLMFIYPEELDLFVLQVVLQSLKKSNYILASGFFYNFIKSHPDLVNSSDFPFFLPVLNFIHLFFRALTAKSYPQCMLLLKLYESSLKRDRTNFQMAYDIIPFYITNINEHPSPVSEDSHPQGLVRRMIDSLSSSFRGMVRRRRPFHIATGTNLPPNSSASGNNQMDLD